MKKATHRCGFPILNQRGVDYSTVTDFARFLG